MKPMFGSYTITIIDKQKESSSTIKYIISITYIFEMTSITLNNTMYE